MKLKHFLALLLMASFMLAMFNVVSMVSAESDYPDHCTNSKEDKVVGMETGNQFNVTKINVDKGECFTIVIQNKDETAGHDFVIDEVGGGNRSIIDADLSGPNIDHVDFDSETPTTDYGWGANGINKFLVHAPNVDATFTYYCDVPGHKEDGMLGKLIVGNGGSKSSPGFDAFSMLIGIFAAASTVMVLRKIKKS